MADPALSAGADAGMLEALEDLLRRARARGAVEADAFMVEEELQTVQVRLGTVESLKHARENRCSLRIFTESGSASATTSDLSPGALARLVDESVRLAQVTRRDEHSGLPAPEALARDVPDLGLWDPDGHAMSVEEKIDRARRAEAAALESDARVRNSEGAEFYDRQGRVAYASSGGFAGGFRVSSFALSVTPVASDEGDMERDFWYTSARRLADPREAHLPVLGDRRLNGGNEHVPVVLPLDVVDGLEPEDPGRHIAQQPDHVSNSYRKRCDAPRDDTRVDLGGRGWSRPRRSRRSP